MRIDDYDFLQLKIAVASHDLHRARQIIDEIENNHKKAQIKRDLYTQYKKTKNPEFLKTYHDIADS